MALSHPTAAEQMYSSTTPRFVAADFVRCTKISESDSRMSSRRRNLQRRHEHADPINRYLAGTHTQRIETSREPRRRERQVQVPETGGQIEHTYTLQRLFGRAEW